MRKIIVGDQELPAAEVSSGGVKVLVYPPELAQKVRAKLQTEAKLTRASWAPERRERKNSEWRFGDPYALRTGSRWPLVR